MHPMLHACAERHMQEVVCPSLANTNNSPLQSPFTVLDQLNIVPMRPWAFGKITHCSLLHRQCTVWIFKGDNFEPQYSKVCLIQYLAAEERRLPSNQCQQSTTASMSLTASISITGTIVSARASAVVLDHH
jgi:hypothetical protein